jgi:hypothetical protein
VVIVRSRDDQDLVMRLKNDMEARRITTWAWENDGPSSQETLYQALQDARAVFFIASPRTAYSYEVNKQLETIRLAGHDVTTVWMEGEELEQCLPKWWQSDEVVDARQESYALALAHLLVRLQQRASVILERGTVTQMPIKACKPLPSGTRATFLDVTV